MNTFTVLYLIAIIIYIVSEILVHKQNTKEKGEENERKRNDFKKIS